MPVQGAPHLRLAEPVGQRAARPRHGACALAQMMRLVLVAIGVTTAAAARDSVACANSASAPAQPPATPDQIASWHWIEQAEPPAYTHSHGGLGFGLSPGSHQIGRVGRPRRANGIIRAGRTATRANRVVTPVPPHTTKTLCAIGVGPAWTPDTLAHCRRLPPIAADCRRLPPIAEGTATLATTPVVRDGSLRSLAACNTAPAANRAHPNAHRTASRPPPRSQLPA